MGTASFRTMDLFAGAGGLSFGFGLAGFSPLAAVEMDLDALRTFEASQRSYFETEHLRALSGDIASFNFSEFRGKVDVVIGGPPCQPFSMGGARRGVADSRNGIPHFVRAISEAQPAAFVMENVPGLARGHLKQVLDETLESMTLLGYDVTWRILHAANFGVSQRRQRLMVVGTRIPGFVWPSATHGPGTGAPWVSAKTILDAHNPIGEPNETKITFAKNPDLRPSPWDGHLWNGGGRPVNPEGQVPTLLASMGGNKTPWLDGGNVVQEYHAALAAGSAPRTGVVPGARRLTVEEVALVQGFPQGMPWHGPRSSRYRQIGNAVPVKLARAVAASVAEHLRAA